MPWNLLIFPLLSGFLFIHQFQLFRFRAHRLESERLLLQSAVWGTVLGFSARLIAILLSGTPFGEWSYREIQEVVPFPFIGTAILCLILGFLVPRLLNGVAWIIRGTVWMRLVVALNYDSGLIRLLYNAMNDETPISITLDSRKVYIGYVSEIPATPNDGL